MLFRLSVFPTQARLFSFVILKRAVAKLKNLGRDSRVGVAFSMRMMSPARGTREGDNRMLKWRSLAMRFRDPSAALRLPQDDKRRALRLSHGDVKRASAQGRDDLD